MMMMLEWADAANPRSSTLRAVDGPYDFPRSPAGLEPRGPGNRTGDDVHQLGARMVDVVYALTEVDDMNMDLVRIVLGT
jgi:hypothetical protein